jgi:hypothetical protein
MWEEAVLYYFQTLFQHLPGKINGNQKQNVNLDKILPGPSLEQEASLI